MIKLLKFFAAIVFVTMTIGLNAQCRLEIEIINLRNDKGKVMLEFFNAEHEVVTREMGDILQGKSTIIFYSLKNGRYALRYFHDENSNGKLDMNWLGIPTEGYGFSNNAYGTFGPESFEKWLFEVEGNTKIVLKTKN